LPRVQTLLLLTTKIVCSFSLWLGKLKSQAFDIDLLKRQYQFAKQQPLARPASQPKPPETFPKSLETYRKMRKLYNENWSEIKLKPWGDNDWLVTLCSEAQAPSQTTNVYPHGIPMPPHYSTDSTCWHSFSSVAGTTLGHLSVVGQADNVWMFEGQECDGQALSAGSSNFHPPAHSRRILSNETKIAIWMQITAGLLQTDNNYMASMRRGDRGYNDCTGEKKHKFNLLLINICIIFFLTRKVIQ